MIVLLVDAHGDNTKGKCSPDRSILEWEYSQRLCTRIEELLDQRGITAVRINPETQDIPISTSAKRANMFAKKYGNKNCLLLSPHLNAAPPNDAKWHGASGFSAYVYTKASVQSCRLAKFLVSQALADGFRGNRAVPTEGFWRANFGILRETSMPAVLTENLYQDNVHDVELLKTPEVFEKIALWHVRAVLEYIDKKWYL